MKLKQNKQKTQQSQIQKKNPNDLKMLAFYIKKNQLREMIKLEIKTDCQSIALEVKKLISMSSWQNKKLRTSVILTKFKVFKKFKNYL